MTDKMLESLGSRPAPPSVPTEQTEGPVVADFAAGFRAGYQSCYAVLTGDLLSLPFPSPPEQA